MSNFFLAAATLWQRELVRFWRQKSRVLGVVASPLVFWLLIGYGSGDPARFYAGALVLTENEGNGLLSYAFPKIHIAIVGIEKIIPSMDDLDLFLPLLATYGTGQHITAYNNLIFGPKLNNEPDGPEEMYVILIDNRRTEVLKHIEQRQALAC